MFTHELESLVEIETTTTELGFVYLLAILRKELGRKHETAYYRTRRPRVDRYCFVRHLSNKDASEFLACPSPEAFRRTATAISDSVT